jgi:transcription elongation factor GreA-like protein
MERHVAESDMAIVCFYELGVITMTFSYDDRCLVEVLTRYTREYKSEAASLQQDC